MTGDNEPGSFEVGYKKPPKATQFKKGQSGNPRVRPRRVSIGSGELLDLAIMELASKIEIVEGGERKSISRLEALLKSSVGQSIKDGGKSSLHLLRFLERMKKILDDRDDSEIQDMTTEELEECLMKDLDRRGYEIRKRSQNPKID